MIDHKNGLNLLVSSNYIDSKLCNDMDRGGDHDLTVGLTPIWSYIFNNDDYFVPGRTDQMLQHIPIIPMVLLNQSIGIGVGYSTTIYPCNPIDVCNNIIRLINNEKPIPMDPWFRNFKGKIEKIDETKYVAKGLYEIVDEYTIHITELPTDISVNNYLKFINELMKERDFIDSYTEKCTNNQINIAIKLIEPIKHYDLGLIEKNLRLVSVINLNNMCLIDTNCKIKKYHSYNDILQDFFNYRLPIYQNRKDFLLEKSEKKIKFINQRLNMVNYPHEINYYINEANILNNQISKLKSSTIQDLWTEDLKKFMEAYKNLIII